jgi:hypothetical protein
MNTDAVKELATIYGATEPLVIGMNWYSSQGFPTEQKAIDFSDILLNRGYETRGVDHRLDGVWSVRWR